MKLQKNTVYWCNNYEHYCKWNYEERINLGTELIAITICDHRGNVTEKYQELVTFTKLSDLRLLSSLEKELL
jgi:hypothetical protein